MKRNPHLHEGAWGVWHCEAKQFLHCTSGCHKRVRFATEMSAWKYIGGLYRDRVHGRGFQEYEARKIE